MHLLHIIIYLIAFAFCLGISNTEAAGKKFVVVLDAGHGGKDPGAIGSKRSNNEKTINLNVVKEVGRLLQNNCPDINVLYTRKTDIFVPLDGRASIANKAKADLFISVHVNALPKRARKAAGVQSYTLTLRTAGTNLEVEKRENSVIQFEENGASKYSFANPNSAESDIMFELMQDRDMKESVAFAEMAQKEMVRTGGRKDMGVLQANLAVLRLTYMPSVLLEIGYISTPSEEQFLITDYGQKLIARSIYNAIVKYKKRNDGELSELEQIQTVQNNERTTTNTSEERLEEKSETSKTEAAPTDTPATLSSIQEDSSQANDNTPKYRVQIMSGKIKLSKNSKQFKGLQVDMHKFGDIFKYTYGAAATMQEARKLKKSIADKFPNAFIVNY